MATQEKPNAKMPDQELEVLVGEGRQGDFVHQYQEMGTDTGFKNVSKLWLKNGCLSYDTVAKRIEEGHSQIQDFRIPLKAIKPVIADDKNNTFGFVHEGVTFKPTRHALGQIAAITGIGMLTVETLSGLRKDTNGVDRNRRQDREALLTLLDTGFSLIDPDKSFLIRTQKDGTLRGWLSGKYQIMDNHLLLDIIRNIIPDGLFSHWKDDGDYSTLWGNVLIPDTIRSEKDSDYGAMYSIGNSEIGRRKMGATPSLFRAICMNGCIWDQKRGKGYQKVHRGLEIDKFALQREMREHLTKQIPLINSSIDDFLGTRLIGWDGATVLSIFAAVANEFNLNKLTATEIVQSWRKQCNEEESFREDKSLRTSAFSIINAVTRSATETKDPQEWVRRDELGGRLLDWKKDKWKNLFSDAKSLSQEEVHKAFAVEAH